MESRKDETETPEQATTDEPAEQDEKDHVDDNSCLSTTPPPQLKPDPWNCIPLYIEIALRMTAAAFVAYSLAYAGVEGSVNAIPQSLAWLIGLLAPIVAMRLPAIAPVATPGPLIMCLTVLLFGLGSVTAFLCAGTVSNGLFVGLSAVWCFWITGLRFGPTAPYSYAFTGVLAVMFGLLGLGMLDVVQQGVIIQIDREALVEIVGGKIEPPTSIPTLPELLNSIRSILSLLQQIVKTGQVCAPVDEGFFRGQEVCLTYNRDDDAIIISVEGGIWLINRFWTTTGVNNPFALIPNFWIIACWSCLAGLFVAPLLPPVRTIRYALSVRALPRTLRDVVWLNNRWRPGHNDSSTDSADEDIMVQSRLEESVNILLGGKIAVVTAFEPRMLDYRCGVPRCTWEALKEVTCQVERVAVRALILRSKKVKYPVGMLDRIRASKQCFEKNAVALETRMIQTPAIPDDKEQSSDQENPPSLHDSLGFQKSCEKLTTAATEWLVAFHGAKSTSTLTFKDGLANVAKNTLLWLLPTVGFLARLIQIPLIPLLVYKGVYKTDIGIFMHYVKFTIGFTALTCMTVYWDAWTEFELVDEEQEGPVQLISGGPPTSFSGWHLIAYCFATMATTEGTVKKCVFRLAGTLVGAFSAWALIRACDTNAYGGVAWLTVTAFPAILLTLDRRSELSLLGPSKDFGYGGFYFVLTQSVIVMEFLAGVGDGDKLVVTRIVSNITGILMAALLAVIPPTLKGSDPKYLNSMLDQIKSSSVDFVDTLIANEDAVEKLERVQKDFAKRFGSVHSNAKYLLEDAKRGSFLPIYKIDNRFQYQFIQMTITSSLVTLWMDSAIEVIKENGVFLGGVEEPCRSRLDSILDALRDGKVLDSKDENTDIKGSKAQVFVGSMEILLGRITEHKVALQSLTPSRFVPQGFV